jgi:DNA repair exonuclease SbcCD ATPase subunit
MPWFKCSHCRIRRSGLDVAISAAQDTCPLCGRTLDPERDLSALMGFRFLAGAVPARGGLTSEAASDALAAERWLNEGGRNEPRR